MDLWVTIVTSGGWVVNRLLQVWLCLSHSAAKLPTMVTIFGNITLNKCFPVNGYFIGFEHVISTGN